MGKRYRTTIERNHGTRKAYTIREYEKRVNTVTSLTPRKEFLLECRKHTINPKFITNSTTHVKQLIPKNSKHVHELNKILSTFHQKVLNIVIKHTCTKLQLVEHEMYVLQEQILDTFPIHFTDEYLVKQKQYADIRQADIRQTHTNKFNELYRTLVEKFDAHTDEKGFINLTSVEVPNDVKWLLSLGPKFTLPHNNDDFPLLDVITDCEDVIKSIQDPKVKDIVRAKISTVVSKFTTNKQRKTTQNTILEKIYNNTKHFRKKHENVVILNADKGKSTVLMYKDEYHKKVDELLNDRTTYKELDRDPTNKLQQKNNIFINQIRKLEIITQREKFRLTTHSTTAPKLYALPKIHKPGVPMRPVVATVNTPSSLTSKMLAEILMKSMNNNEHSIKNSFEFKKMLNDIRMDEAEKMVSFDVISLFTNIPVPLAMDIISEEWQRIEANTNIPKELFMSMMWFCLLDANYFAYNNKYYRQIYGMPMGNPLSTIIADIVMNKLIEISMETLSCRPKLFVRYVDDIFAIIKKDKIQDTLEVLNKYHEKLQFTVEEEDHGKLAYLDVLVIRNRMNGLETNWYKKKSASNRILNYYSQHPKTQILNTARNFISRVLNLSSPVFHTENMRTIEKCLQQNNYPMGIIKRIKKSEMEKYRHLDNTPREREQKVYKCMTYIKGASERIGKVIQEHCPDTQLAYKSNKRVSNLFSKMKEKIPDPKKTHVVYKIPCKGHADTGTTCGFCYVGQTKQYLEKRIKNHKYDLKKDPNSRLPKTALMEHFYKDNHYPDFDATKIIGTQQNFNKRLTLESLHIYTNNTINIKEDTDNIAASYCVLLDNYTRKRKRNDIQVQHDTNTHNYNDGTIILPPTKKRRTIHTQ